MGKIYNNAIALQQGFKYTERVVADDRTEVQSLADLTTLVVPPYFVTFVRDVLDENGLPTPYQWNGFNQTDLANWINPLAVSKQKITNLENETAALTSGIRYTIPQAGNTPTTEPAPTENGIYRVKTINATYTNFGGIVVPNDEGFIYDIQVSGIGVSPVYTLLPTDVNLPIDAIPTNGSANAVQSNGVFDALALKADKTIRDKVNLTLITTPNYISNLGTQVTDFVSGAYLLGSAINTNLQALAFHKTYSYTYVAGGSTFPRLVYLKNVSSGNAFFRSILVTDNLGNKIIETNKRGDFTLFLYDGWTVQATSTDGGIYQGIVETSMQDKVNELLTFKTEFDKIKFFEKGQVLDNQATSTLVAGSRFNINGDLETDANYYYQSNYTKVLPNKNIRYEGFIFQARYIVFYDKNKAVIGSVRGSVVSPSLFVNFLTPANCYYTRACIEASALANFKMIYNDDLSEDTHSLDIKIDTVASTATSFNKLKNRDNNFSLYSFLDRFRNTYGTQRRININMIGDSLTAGTDDWSPVDTIYEIFGSKCGYGGIGYIPCHSEQKGDQLNAIGFEQTGWQLRNQTQSVSFRVGWFTKCASIGLAGAGSLFIGVKQAFKDHPKYEFDTVKIYAYSNYANGSLRFRATDGSTFGSGINGSGAWVTQAYVSTPTTTPDVTVTTLTGFGVSTGRYVLECDASLITNSANISIGAIELINSKGGVTVHRMAIGGYKASDHSTQYEVAQKSYFTNFGIDATIINLGENDFATSDVDFLANMNIIIDRVKTARPDTPIFLVNWWSLVHDAKRALIDQLATDNGLQTIDTKEIILNWTDAFNKDLLNSPLTVNDPHLNAKGSNFVGALMAKSLGVDVVQSNLQI